MAFVSLVICASALFVQTAFGACIGTGFGAPFGLEYGCGFNNFAAPLAYEGLGYGLAPFAYDGAPFGCGVASTGGGLPCASASSFPPVGVSVLSENVYEGPLAVGGSLPFLGSVALEGVLPTAGAGAVSYGCGSGVGIAVEEGPIATGMAPYAGVAPEIGFYGYGPAGFGTAGFGAAGFGYPGAMGFGYDGLGYGFAGRGFGFNGCGAVY